MDEIIKKKLARNWFKTLQEVLCKEIEELEGGSKLFKYKNWERGKKSNEGGGQSRIYENGKIFEGLEEGGKVSLCEKFGCQFAAV